MTNRRSLLWLLAAFLPLALTHPAVAQTSAELAVLKADYRRPPPKSVGNPELAELGRLLFWDPRASASGNTACVSCHFPYLGWSVTDQRSRNDSGKLTSRRSQTLLGMSYIEGSPFGWDGRNASLEAQTKNSIATGSMSMRETATPVKVEVIEERIRNIPEYADMFRKVMPDGAVTIDNIAKAIAAYERTFEPGIAPFDRWVEGDEAAISESAKRGFLLFNTTANCAVCHGGWRFTDDRFHDIGTTTTDLGRGRDIKDDEMMKYAFKTPSLRSVALRPPYMHNGVAVTLYDVVRHYEGGGIDRPSRSPGMMKLELSEQDRLDLVAFMQTLTGMPEGDTPPKLPPKR
ncbi:MAG TPA: cytochrome c peroxidase [Alphaproteobacteria bacterium]|nr:cytochrome c peroxidase [Alphaproteobacteria bacterium]